MIPEQVQLHVCSPTHSGYLVNQHPDFETVSQGVAKCTHVLRQVLKQVPNNNSDLYNDWHRVLGFESQVTNKLMFTGYEGMF